MDTFITGQTPQGEVFVTDFNGDYHRVNILLEASGLSKILAAKSLEANSDFNVLIKPNIVNDSPPPITTPWQLVDQIVKFIKDSIPNAQIYIADGTGELDRDTLELFSLHGYTANIKGVTFLDLNTEPCIKVPLKKGLRWQEMYLPEIVFSSFLISVPVLKAHTLAGVTLSMKNLIGICPPKYYQQGGHWKKSSFHFQIDKSIFDLVMARRPDFVLIDGSVGMAQSHLGGPKCNPPVNKLIAGFDPVAADAYGTELLGKKWQDIGHIKLANGIIGRADKLSVRNIQ